MVLASDCGVNDFLLGQNVLRKYNVLVDLTARKIVIRNPLTPKLYQPQHQVSDDFSLLLLGQDVTLDPYERKTVQAKVVTENREEFAYRNVMLTQQKSPVKSTIVLDDSLATVTGNNLLITAVKNPTNVKVRLYSSTLIGMASLVTFNFEKIDIPRTTSSVQKIETGTQSGHDFVYRIDVDSILSSESSDEFSSFARNFLSSTDSSEH